MHVILLHIYFKNLIIKTVLCIFTITFNINCILYKDNNFLYYFIELQRSFFILLSFMMTVSSRIL